jgi:hypothetical protein
MANMTTEANQQQPNKMLTVAELRERLGWSGVDEVANAQYGLVYLNVRPTRPGREPIYFCMDEDRSFIQQFGFGEWHSHPNEIEEAVETARLLLRGERCVVEERDAAGNYLGSGLCPPDGLPGTLGKKAASLRRCSSTASRSPS